MVSCFIEKFNVVQSSLKLRDWRKGFVKEFLLSFKRGLGLQASYLDGSLPNVNYYKATLGQVVPMWMMWCAGVHATSDPRYVNLWETSTTNNRDHHRRRKQTRSSSLVFAHARRVHFIELLSEPMWYRWPMGWLFHEWRGVVSVVQIRGQRDQYLEVTVTLAKNWVYLLTYLQESSR